jgi:hypothetical protein
MSKPEPVRYRTTNWSAHNFALRKRGSLLIWLDKEKAWHARKHGVQGRHQWRKVHLATDTTTADIRAVELTPPSRAGDSPVLPDLLDQIPEGEDIGTVTADGAHDTRRCHSAIIVRGATTITPSARTADRGKRIAQLHGRAAKPCAPHATTAARSGNGGQDTTPAAVPKPGCAVSSPTASASPREAPTARPPKSTSAWPEAVG